MVLIFLVSSAVIKVGRLFVNTQISAAALINVFSVSVRRLFEYRAKSIISDTYYNASWVVESWGYWNYHENNDNETTAARLAS